MLTAPRVSPEGLPSSSLTVKRVSFQTLGCRLNQSETEVLARSLVQQGWQVVPEAEPADLCVVNTCTVTEHSDAKNRQAIRALKRRNPGAAVAVVGCYAQMAPDEVAAIDGVQLVIGNADKLRLSEFLPQALAQEAPLVVKEKIARHTFEAPVVPLLAEGPEPSRSGGAGVFRTRASLKVQDGCDFMCSFCIIPFARGRSRSRDFGNLQEEARLLVEQEQVRELILTGVNVGTYATSEKTLLEVIDFLQGLPELARIRISSIEPTTVPEVLLEYMADPQHKLVPFLHLPLQSGSTKVLAEMKRRYTATEYADEVLRAFERVPDLCIGTDVMVGFPGESEAEFEETRTLLTELPIHYFHVFPFSERAGTPAFRRTDLVPPEQKQRRSELLRDLSRRKRRLFQERFLGTTREVLLEAPRPDGRISGLTDNYLRVHLHPDAGPLPPANQLVPVCLQAVEKSGISGTLSA